MVRARITRACITTDHGEDDGSGTGPPIRWVVAASVCPPIAAAARRLRGSSVIRFENFYKDGSWLSVVLPKYMLLPVEDLHGPVRSGGRWTLPLFDTPPPTSSNERVCSAIDRNKDGIDYTGFHGSRQDLDLKL
ncbi:unnamed protein product [Spirodela intermedia]|uniref:Uncharacterized protein n=1 Tax=Spirodela intermedia TaxID=51605 RepID=A0A7I8JK84_SPIIN|nr:unnamed protein product [Spirodela intermedia]CAA6670195.1 unnamed protein product [Spirodela intermedia]